MVNLNLKNISKEEPHVLMTLLGFLGIKYDINVVEDPNTSVVFTKKGKGTTKDIITAAACLRTNCNLSDEGFLNETQYEFNKETNELTIKVKFLTEINFRE